MKLLDEAKFPYVKSSLILVEHDTASPLNSASSASNYS